MERAHILISLEPRHANNILNGRKVVELRRRAMLVEPGTIMWIYAKRPCGELVGWAEILSVDASSPTAAWRQYGCLSALSRREFFSYFAGRPKAYVLRLGSVCRLRRPVPLQRLRRMYQRFQPPQFFKRLDQPPVSGECCLVNQPA